MALKIIEFDHHRAPNGIRMTILFLFYVLYWNLTRMITGGAKLYSLQFSMVLLMPASAKKMSNFPCIVFVKWKTVYETTFSYNPQFIAYFSIARCFHWFIRRVFWVFWLASYLHCNCTINAFHFLNKKFTKRKPNRHKLKFNVRSQKLIKDVYSND